MNIIEIIKWGLLGATLLCVIIMAIVAFVSKIGIALLIFSLIALTFISTYKVIEILQSKGIIK